MGESIIRGRVIDEIKRIPENKLPEVYDFLHFFRLGLQKSKGGVEETMKFAGCWDDMPDKIFNDFLDEIRQRRDAAFSRRRRSEARIG
ncbi:MAG: hypothetical protein HZB79_07140 [Deltaproteobacteria bacterium]|nr:hypothetical protein [Deltaproteobacteria bacterium]